MTQTGWGSGSTNRAPWPSFPPPPPAESLRHHEIQERYKARNLIERMSCRLKDFRRIATRYDKRADIFLSAICLAAAISWWI
ncbi:transposase [Celeribacter indicus]|uniref:Transposase n=1 Tax=Celeribacter indicus TaxID=1208324 RepID=A0A0B5DY56_9RHOB|nr:transposase [Celeribacter indicus]AJE47934.1 transposase [Celeribacter indicus]